MQPGNRKVSGKRARENPILGLASQAREEWESYLGRKDLVEVLRKGLKPAPNERKEEKSRNDQLIYSSKELRGEKAGSQLQDQVNERGGNGT